jgi:hypothetical protein
MNDSQHFVKVACAQVGRGVDTELFVQVFLQFVGLPAAFLRCSEHPSSLWIGQRRMVAALRRDAARRGCCRWCSSSGWPAAGWRTRLAA